MLSDKVVEGTAVEVKQPLRPEMWLVLYDGDNGWSAGVMTYASLDAALRQQRRCVCGTVIVRIPAEDSE